MGSLAWGASTLMLLWWLTGVATDAKAGLVSASWMIAAMAAALAWSVLAWRAWSSWQVAGEAITLSSTGPVRVTRPAHAAPHVLDAQGGFVVDEWRSPVRVRMLIDLQRWVLLAVSEVCRPDVGRGQPVRQCTCWVDLENPERRALHQLRTLLYLPSSMVTQEGGMAQRDHAKAAKVLKPVASWAVLFQSGTALQRTKPSTSPSVRPSPSLGDDTLFPSTALMEEDETRGGSGAHAANQEQMASRRRA